MSDDPKKDLEEQEEEQIEDLPPKKEESDQVKGGRPPAW